MGLGVGVSFSTTRKLTSMLGGYVSIEKGHKVLEVFIDDFGTRLLHGSGEHSK